MTPDQHAQHRADAAARPRMAVPPPRAGRTDPRSPRTPAGGRRGDVDYVRGLEAGQRERARRNPDLGGVRHVLGGSLPPAPPPSGGGGGGGGGRKGCGPLALLLLPWLILLAIFGGGRHRAAPEPGDPGWTHPDVRGMTNPKAIRALTRAMEIQEQRERDALAERDRQRREAS